MSVVIQWIIDSTSTHIKDNEIAPLNMYHYGVPLICEWWDVFVNGAQSAH